MTIHGSTGTTGTSGSSYSVSSPCGYEDMGTRKDYGDFYFKSGQLRWANNDPGEWAPGNQVAAHRDDTKGHWYAASCGSYSYTYPMTAADRAYLKMMADYSQQHIAAGDEWIYAADAVPPVSAIPPNVMEAVAYDAATKAIPTPNVAAYPQTRAVTKLPVFAWLGRGEYAPVWATATAPLSRTVTVRADPAGISIVNYPAGAQVDSACTNGGTPNARMVGQSDCWIAFPRTTPYASFEISTNWRISAVPANLPLNGPNFFQRVSAPFGLPVAEVETYGTN